MKRIQFRFISLISEKNFKAKRAHPMRIRNPANKAGSLKMNTALEYSTRLVQEGGRRCKKSTLNDLVHAPDPSKNTFNEPTYRQVTDNMYLVGRDQGEGPILSSYM